MTPIWVEGSGGAFFAAARNRLMCGLEPRADAPLQAPPGAPTSIELLACEEPDEFAFVLRGVPGAGSGLRAVVRISPAMSSRGLAPRPHVCRLIHGFAAASAPEVAASGEALVFRGARFRIEPGQRFGVVVRLMREADGVHGPECFADLRRVFV